MLAAAPLMAGAANNGARADEWIKPICQVLFGAAHFRRGPVESSAPVTSSATTMAAKCTSRAAQSGCNWGPIGAQLQTKHGGKAATLNSELYARFALANASLCPKQWPTQASDTCTPSSSADEGKLRAKASAKLAAELGTASGK